MSAFGGKADILKAVYAAVMLSPHELSQFPFLSAMSAGGRARLLSAARQVILEPNTEVLARGEEVAGAYLVESGALRIYYVNADGREGTLYWVDPGQSCILALNCLFARLAYPAWVKSDQEETRVSIVSGDVYRELFRTEPAVQHFTFEALSTRLFELMTLLRETASLGLEQRVAAFLLRRPRTDQVMETTHEKIAQHVGSSREVVSRVLRNLAGGGTLELMPGRISILDPDKLRDIFE